MLRVLQAVGGNKTLAAGSRLTAAATGAGALLWKRRRRLILRRRRSLIAVNPSRSQNHGNTLAAVGSAQRHFRCSWWRTLRVEMRDSIDGCVGTLICSLRANTTYTGFQEVFRCVFVRFFSAVGHAVGGMAIALTPG